MCNIRTLRVISHTESMAKVIESGPEQLVHQNSVLLYPSTKDHKIRCTNIQNNTYLFILSATIIGHCRIVAGCYSINSTITILSVMLHVKWIALLTVDFQNCPGTHH